MGDFNFESDDFNSEMVLIDLIQHYPLVYDKSLKDYKDNNKKSNAWASIADALSLTVEDVQKMWRNLRERFAKERRVTKNPPSGSAPPECTWPLYKYMMLMEKHILTRKRCSNVLRPSSASSGGGTSTSDVCTPLVSPTGNVENIFSTSDTFLTEEFDNQHSTQNTEVEVIEEAGPKKKLRVSAATPASLTPTAASSTVTPTSSALRSVKKKKETEVTIEQSLKVMTEYIKSKSNNLETPDRCKSFGNYVGLTLSDMPKEKQNKIMLKIVEILNEHDVNE